MAIQIFKLQRSIVTTEPDTQVLIYNEDRSYMGQLQMTPEVADLFPQYGSKIYIHGDIDEDGVIEFLNQAEQQDW
jgi:hypothetical protein